MATNPSQQQDITYFIELQRRVLDIFRYVSCHENNFSTYSILIESVLVDSGSFFDSLCQSFIRAKVTNGHTFWQQPSIVQFSAKVAGEKEFNFGDYRKLLEPEFAMSKKEVRLNPYEGLYVNPLSLPPANFPGYSIAPFKEWATANPSNWWKAFTALKHDRIANFHEASLRNLIFALAAVFIVLSVYNETEFKDGKVSPVVYDLFCPKYWTFRGRVTVANWMWR